MISVPPSLSGTVAFILLAVLTVHAPAFGAGEPYLDSVTAKSLWAMGTAYEQKGQKDKALECYQRSLKVSKNARTYYDIGKCLSNMKRNEEALDAFGKALDLCTANKESNESRNVLPYVYAGMAIVYADLKDSEKELECFTKAAAAAEVKSEIRPAFKATVYYNLGVLQQDKDVDGALASFNKALVAANADQKIDIRLVHQIHYAIGTVYFRKGDHQKAFESFSQAGDLSPFDGIFPNNFPAGDRQQLDGKPLRAVPDDMS